MKAYRVAAVAALTTFALALPAVAEEVPSNAELFRMLKEQQKTIGQLKSELKQSRDELRKTQTAMRPGPTREAARASSDRAPAGPAMAGLSSNPYNANAAYTKAAPIAAPNTFTLSADVLWLKAGLGDTTFVLNGATGNNNPNGTALTNDPNDKAAFRLSAAYTFGDTGREIIAAWSHLNINQAATVAGPALWATVGRADFASNFEAYSGTATSSVGLNYDRIDLLLGEPLKWSDARFSFLYGLEYARIGVSEDYSFVSGGTTGTANYSSKLSGIGPQIGAKLDYDLIRNSSILPGTLGLNVMSTGSLLYAKTSSTALNSLGATTILNVTDQGTQRIVPAVHARAGLSYTFPIASGIHGQLSGGYEFNTYFGGITRQRYDDDVADGLSFRKYQNLDLSGPYGSLAVKF